MYEKEFPVKIVIVLIIIFSSFSVKAAEYEFLPVSHPELSIRFMGKTQAGEGYHKLEIIQLGFTFDSNFEKTPTNGYYIIYDSDDRFGPTILKRLNGHSPYINKISENTVKIEYTAGNKGHTRQTWKLLGHTAELEKEENITWKDRNYVTKFDAE